MPIYVYQNSYCVCKLNTVIQQLSGKLIWFVYYCVGTCLRMHVYGELPGGSSYQWHHIVAPVYIYRYSWKCLVKPQHGDRCQLYNSLQNWHQSYHHAVAYTTNRSKSVIVSSVHTRKCIGDFWQIFPKIAKLRFPIDTSIANTSLLQYSHAGLRRRQVC